MKLLSVLVCLHLTQMAESQSTEPPPPPPPDGVLSEVDGTDAPPVLRGAKTETPSPESSGADVPPTIGSSEPVKAPKADAQEEGLRGKDRAPNPEPGPFSPEPPSEGTPPAKTRRKEQKDWQGNLGLNVILLTGNTEAITGTILAGFKANWYGWGLAVNGDAAYGRSVVDGEEQTTAYNAQIQARGNYDFTELVGTFISAGVGTDRVASVELRGYGETGLALTWWDEREGDFVKANVRTDLGFRYTREVREQFYPTRLDIDDIDIYAPSLTLTLRYAPTKNLVFTEDLNIIQDVINTANTRVTSATVVSVTIWGDFSLRTGFKVRFVGDPPPLTKKTDTELSLGVSWAI